MSAGTNRNVEVKMKFTADSGHASKAMQDLERQAQKTGKAVADANRQATQGGAASSDGASGGSSGGQNAWHGAMMAFGKVAAAVYTFGKALDAATKGLDTLATSKAMSPKRLEGAADFTTMGLYSWFANKADKLVYADDRNKYAGYAEKEGPYQGSQALMHGYRMKDRSLAEEALIGIDSAEETSRRRLAGLAIGAQGRKAGTDPRTTGALMDLEGSMGEFNVADRAHGRSGAAIAKLKAEEQALQAKRDGLTVTDPGGRNVWRTEMEKSNIRYADTALMQKKMELEAAINEHKKNGLALEQKRYEIGVKGVNVSKAELDIVKEKEAKAKSFASSFGMASGADKLALQSAIGDANRFGIDTLSEDRRNLIGRFAPEWTAKRAGESVQGDPVYEAVTKMLGEKTAGQLAERKIELEGKIDIEMQVNEETLAKNIAEKLKVGYEQMTRVALEVAKAQEAIVWNVRKTIGE